MKNKTKSNKQLFQIFYDQETKNSLDLGFIPLNNQLNPRPDWMEFWVIRDFLLNNPLDDNTWYGFFSPKFYRKTKLKARDIEKFLDLYGDKSEVALFTHSWDAIAYYQNVFEQGDYIHPNMMEVAQNFLEKIEIDVNLNSYVDCSRGAVFSNYIVAKPRYWRNWLKIANHLFDICEDPDASNSLAVSLRKNTKYRGGDGMPMKIFIQERLPSILLSIEKYSIAPFDVSRIAPLTMSTNKVFDLIKSCDLLKQLYIQTQDETFLRSYQTIRSEIFKDKLEKIKRI